jgi:hypothetical protein
VWRLCETNSKLRATSVSLCGGCAKLTVNCARHLLVSVEAEKVDEGMDMVSVQYPTHMIVAVVQKCSL